MNTFLFFREDEIFVVQAKGDLSASDIDKLQWLLSASRSSETVCRGRFVGPRREMVTPWSTNATEICQHVGICGIVRIEQFSRVASGTEPHYDRMLEAVYDSLGEHTLIVDAQPEPVRAINDIESYNFEAGLALSLEEIEFLQKWAVELGRPLTDSEIYGFGQINSEHCRHKIFNGVFVVDGEEGENSLFGFIKETSKHSPNALVSAYKDNVAFILGPRILQFAPDYLADDRLFALTSFDTVISLKAETHNFPTTVEPFNGASTGSGGEIRDRMAGGIGSIPLVGTAVYMTAYPRLGASPSAAPWEQQTEARPWKYQSPMEILIKASNGASDFGNKFGQPLIVGSLLTFEGKAGPVFYGYDRTVMLAGGVGYARTEHARKHHPSVGDKLVLLGGDNYRIGMAGGSVSSVDTGAYSEDLELSAVQRANPEMQKRVFNVVRALSEISENPVRSIHDHGAGGHMNCLAELLEGEGGTVWLSRLPLGDPTLSAREIICNESQERMGLLVSAESLPLVEQLAERERSPIYEVGEVTGNNCFVVEVEEGNRPVDLPMDLLLGSSPKTIIRDETVSLGLSPVAINIRTGDGFVDALAGVISLEGVACKDWLTNKVDRSVTGRVAQQQCVGPLHLPLADVGVVALDYSGSAGIATALGHAPVAGIVDEESGSVLSVTEALLNLVWAPLTRGLESVVLSANWMWPAKQPGEDARLYRAVRKMSRFAMELGVAIPTGKDSLSMTMKYADGQTVRAPGTVIVTAVGECSDVRRCVTPDLKPVAGTRLLYVDFSGLGDCPLGGSSFAQSLGEIGDRAPTVVSASVFREGFAYLQDLIRDGRILAGHDVSSGGVLGCLCEMAFAGDVGFNVSFRGNPADIVAFAFCEKPAVIIQIAAENLDDICQGFRCRNLGVEILGETGGSDVRLRAGALSFSRPVSDLRKIWFETSFHLDQHQTRRDKAVERFQTFSANHLRFVMPDGFTGRAADYGVDIRRAKPTGLRAAIVREKGTNGDREMAFSMFAAGFDVKDVTMSDLMSGRETLDDVKFIVFPGGFSNSDVLGAARGWAGVFRYNERAKMALERFYARPDTLSLGVCNGCQLMVVLDILYPEHTSRMAMMRNDSCKFESTFVNLSIGETKSVLLKPLQGCVLGAWIAHGEGKFSLPEGESAYDIGLRYIKDTYPANPNGSQYRAAGVVSSDGRHLAMMPHLERSVFPWQWPYLSNPQWRDWQITPWMLAFAGARDWIAAR